MKKLVLLFGFIIVLSLSLFVGCSNDNDNSINFKYHKDNLATLSTVVDSSTAEKMLTALENSCVLENDTKLVKEDIIKYSNSTYELYAGLMVRFDIQDTQVKLYTFETTYSDNSAILLYDSSSTNTTKVLSKEERNSLIYTQRRYTVHNTIRISPRSGSLLHNALGSVKIDDLTFTNRSNTALTYVNIVITPYISGTSYSYNNSSYMLDAQLSIGASATRDLTKSDWHNYDSYKITQATIVFADGTTIGFNAFDCQFLDGNGDSQNVILRDSTITYHLYDDIIETQSYYSGFGVNSLKTPYREEYIFAGWYDNEFYNGQPIENIEIGVKSNLNLYAKWEEKVYVNYHYQYDSKVENTFIGKNTNYTLITPTRLGYSFGGWFSNSECMGSSILEVSNLQESIDVFAKWIGNPINIVFDGNLSDFGTMQSQTISVGESNILLENQYMREGYIFAGWYLSGNEEILYQNQAKFTMNPTIEETITLYAKWEPRNDIPYIVNHYLQNLDDYKYTLKESISHTGTANSTILPATNQYNGFTSPNLKTVTVAVDGSLAVDYYYTRNNYSITLVSNDGTSHNTIVQKFESSFSLPTVERSGYTFGGWFLDSALTIPLKTLTVPSEDISLYVWWVEENKPIDFTYTITDFVTINSYKGNDTAVVIPTYIAGINVKEISAYAFNDKNSISKVIIPNSVNKIGTASFKGCSSLEEITLPFVGFTINDSNGSTRVLGHIFGSTKIYSYNKTSSGQPTYQYFHSAPVGQSYELGYYIPQSLRKITITKQTSIPANAFQYCDLLEEIILPNDTISIGEQSFYQCSKLSSINTSLINTFCLPNTLSNIGNNAFNNCTNVSTIKLGAEITHIGAGAFAGCVNVSRFNSEVLGELIIPQSLEILERRVFVNLGLITKIIVPENIVSVGDGAFEGITSLEEITLPFVGSTINDSNGSTRVLGHIFGSTRIYSHNKTSSGQPTYQYFHSAPVGQSYELGYYIPQSLRKITITKQTSIPANAFQYCDLLEEIILPNNTTLIGEQSFYQCTNVTLINIGDSLLSIGESSFAMCEKLKEIYIPSSVEMINSYAFNGCSALTIKYELLVIPTTWDKDWNYSNCSILTGCSKN